MTARKYASKYLLLKLGVSRYILARDQHTQSMQGFTLRSRTHNDTHGNSENSDSSSSYATYVRDFTYSHRYNSWRVHFHRACASKLSSLLSWSNVSRGSPR